MKAEMIKPFGDKILVKRAESKTMTNGGIIIPEIAIEAQDHGEVVAVGHGKLTAEGGRIPLEVKAGDKIFFTRNAVIEVMHAGEEHLIMKEDRVLLIRN